MKPIAEQLSAARRARGYTQEQFAEMLHVSRQAVSHWENGRATPDLNTLQEIARLLDQPALLAPEESALAASGPAQATASDSPAQRRWLPAAACAAALLTLLIVLALTLGALQDKPRAEVVVAPEKPVAYRLRDSDVIWNVMFSFGNVSDVPFRPECIVFSFYTNDLLGESLVLMGEQLVPFMGGETLRRENAPLLMPVGSDRPFYTRIACTLYGTDENGHLLRFDGECQLKYEYAPGDG